MITIPQINNTRSQKYSDQSWMADVLISPIRFEDSQI